MYFRHLFNVYIEKLSSVEVIQGDSRGKANILRADSIGLCEEKCSYELFFSSHNYLYSNSQKKTLAIPAISLFIASKYWRLMCN
jgi:hypothetical protein